jgi:cobyrinic acid a,c-diamide synthase
MFEDTKVTLSLEDFDSLRQYKREYEQLAMQISKCVKFDFEAYEQKLLEISKCSLLKENEIIIAEEAAMEFAKITVNLNELEKVILNNCIEDKTGNDIELFDTLPDPEVKYVYVGGGFCEEHSRRSK